LVIPVIVSAVLFGLATPLSKLLLKDTSPFFLAGLLYFAAGLGLFPFAGFGHVKTELWKRSLRYIIGTILFGGILGPVFFLLGLKMSSASNISLWLSFEVMATALVGYFFFKDRLGIFSWVAVIMGLAAGLALGYTSGSEGLLAIICVLAACACWGMDNNLAALIDGITPIQSAVIKGLCAGTVNLLIALSFGGLAVHFATIGVALLVGAICYGGSLALYIYSAQKMGAVRSQIIFSSAPFWGILGAVILLHEKLSLLQIGAGALWVVAVVLLLVEKHEHAHGHQQTRHIHEHSHNDMHHAHAHDVGVGEPHSHEHGHEKMEHTHAHWPDIHHRHAH
jgi:drug/metabolite transporter (DMT)-like permease